MGEVAWYSENWDSALAPKSILVVVFSVKALVSTTLVVVVVVVVVAWNPPKSVLVFAEAANWSNWALVVASLDWISFTEAKSSFPKFSMFGNCCIWASNPVVVVVCWNWVKPSVEGGFEVFAIFKLEVTGYSPKPEAWVSLFMNVSILLKYIIN